MQIFGPYRVMTTPQQPGSTSPASTEPNQQPSRISNQQVDQLDLSTESTQIEETDGATVEGIRFERVASIRRQIADGVYETDEKLDAALERLLDEIG